MAEVTEQQQKRARRFLRKAELALGERPWDAIRVTPSSWSHWRLGRRAMPRYIEASIDAHVELKRLQTAR
ncbi:MAG: hypothetical protein ACU85V_00145 [Gammaproteobacteria bacterium]